MEDDLPAVSRAAARGTDCSTAAAVAAARLFPLSQPTNSRGRLAGLLTTLHITMRGGAVSVTVATH